MRFVVFSRLPADGGHRGFFHARQVLVLHLHHAAAVHHRAARGRAGGGLVLRGRMEALRAFEPLRDAQYEDPATKSYLEAFAKLEAGDPGAMAAFGSAIISMPSLRNSSSSGSLS